MFRLFSNTSRPFAIRTIIAALVVVIPATAYAVDNGNLGTPQNDCESAATADYNANLASCEKNLAGDDHAIAQCKQDFSYDYLDAIAACKSAAMTHRGISHGTLGVLVEDTSAQPGSGKPIHRKGLKFGQ